MIALKPEAALRLAIERLGGPEAYNLAERHYGDGETLASLEAATGTPSSTIHRRIDNVLTRLSEVGGVPAHWRQQRSGPRP